MQITNLLGLFNVFKNADIETTKSNPTDVLSILINDLKELLISNLDFKSCRQLCETNKTWRQFFKLNDKLERKVIRARIAHQTGIEILNNLPMFYIKQKTEEDNFIHAFRSAPQNSLFIFKNVTAGVGLAVRFTHSLLTKADDSLSSKLFKLLKTQDNGYVSEERIVVFYKHQNSKIKTFIIRKPEDTKNSYMKPNICALLDNRVPGNDHSDYLKRFLTGKPCGTLIYEASNQALRESDTTFKTASGIEIPYIYRT